MRYIKSIILTIIIAAIFAIAPTADAAFYSFDTDKTTVKPGESFELRVHLDTESVNTNAADFVATFSKNQFAIDSISYGTSYDEYFKDLATDGTVRIAAVNTTSGNAFTGGETFITMQVTAERSGVGTFFIECEQSHVWQQNGNGTDVIDCGKQQHLVITVGDGTDTTDSTDTNQDNTYIGGSCLATRPPQPIHVRAESGPANGQITLYWDAVAPITHYGINYGTASGFYNVGAKNIGNTQQFTISNLIPTQTYYFTIYAVNDCAISSISTEVAIAAASSTIPGVDLYPEIEFVPLENQVGYQPESTQSSTLSGMPDDLFETSAAADVEEITDDTGSKGINPWLLFVGAGAVVFLIALYLLGKKRGGGNSELNTPITPRHAEPVSETGKPIHHNAPPITHKEDMNVSNHSEVVHTTPPEHLQPTDVEHIQLNDMGNN